MSHNTSQSVEELIMQEALLYGTSNPAMISLLTQNQIFKLEECDKIECRTSQTTLPAPFPANAIVLEASTTLFQSQTPIQGENFRSNHSSQCDRSLSQHNSSPNQSDNILKRDNSHGIATAHATVLKSADSLLSKQEMNYTRCHVGNGKRRITLLGKSTVDSIKTCERLESAAIDPALCSKSLQDALP